MTEHLTEFALCGGPPANKIWEAAYQGKPTDTPFQVHATGRIARHARLAFDRILGVVWNDLPGSVTVTAKYEGRRITFCWTPDDANGLIELPENIWRNLNWQQS